mmetsp:Transcript_10436/g.26790  ORF Transcript_10436/g.26790 Transcript_10436/m.26790 type:complete len:297 (+) Transcript_10436:432-1322(+)|eukprot:CAMPEP_0182917418 /NCGR_PEP_ID=MMETSP0105_2-20130417/1514_1 /TAXON_ID=81532 ORGANISM="Acanthoeca-like sp., Strain 10tr" /NCGR_SAMPLE_ID=MMETSP0105_2 /ASSEMBLY_ACC=CAM_ASM_000205 /LENGTH=296 /DNA_ID=CAMNT_0025054427 /DNA_START=358 /DNA_END=1248 /DNA_ORIENTATION=-
MCLVTFAYRPETRHPLVVAANRDEYRDRPSAAVSLWPRAADDGPAVTVAAGRDLRSGGTWLGVTSSGRFAALTNISTAVVAPPQTLHCEGGGPAAAPAAAQALAPLRTRGVLVRDFLEGSMRAETYAADVAARSSDFDGFNLVLYDGTSPVVYCTNRPGDGTEFRTRVLEPGVYGVANAEMLREPEWPKVRRSKTALDVLCRTGTHADSNRLLSLMTDRQEAPDGELPNRGKTVKEERRLSPCFIAGGDYGTVNSTAVVFDAAVGKVHITERSFGPRGEDGRVEFTMPLRHSLAPL